MYLLLSRSKDELTAVIIDRNHSSCGNTTCSTCDAIGLEVDNFIIKENELDPARLRQRLDMGHLQQIRQKSFCPLCRLIVNIADRPLDQRLPSREIAEDSNCYLQWVIDGQEEHFSGGAANAKAELIPRTLRLLVYSEPQTFKDGYLVLLGSDAPSPLFFGRRVPTADLDVALIRRWLSACEMEHGDRCERPLVPPAKPTVPITLFG